MLATLRSVPTDSLVFVHPAEHPDVFRDGNDLVFNLRGLDSEVVLARWHEESNQAVIRLVSPAAVYRLDRSGSEFVLAPGPQPGPVHASIPAHRLYRQTGSHDPFDRVSGRILRFAREGEHAEGWLGFGRTVGLPPGRFEARFDLALVPALRGLPCATLDVAADEGRTILARTDLVASEGGETVTLGFEVDRFCEVEPRIRYHGRGEIRLTAVAVVQVAD